MTYRQKHPETCLAKCLIIIIEKLKGIKINRGEELKMLIFFLKYDRDSIAGGHLMKVVRDYKVNVDWYLGFKIIYNFFKKKNFPEKISLKYTEVNLKLIDSLLDSPIIVYVDQFYLWENSWGLYYKYHYPHFVIIKKRVGNLYQIIDPTDGKIKSVTPRTISKAIASMRNRLWISPQIIKIL